MDNPNHTPPQSTAPSYVVGIGASAGGLDALSRLFSCLQLPTGAAYIVIQHLSPTFKSLMDHLLQKQTLMPVSIATQDERLRADHVYLIPSGYDLTLVGQRIQLSEINRQRTLHLPIDHFFISLAEDAKDRAIAVILSGTGSDGTRGISRIKERGGLVLVQNPEEAEFDGMPGSAIRTKLVDAVLPVADIALQIRSYINHPFISEPDDRLFREHLSQKSDFIEKILRRLQDYNGFDFLEYKQSTVARRIERRMGVRNVTDIADYYALVDTDQTELPTLCQEILIGVTEFFREPDIFEYLAETVIPSILSTKDPDDDIRVWVAACSTGEEAYSLAMLFDEVLDKLERKNPIRIFATDIDERAIATAAKGKYPVSALASISDERRAKYFRVAGSEYVIKPNIRKMVVFAQHNLVKDPPFSAMDLVSCRNLLIYLQNSAQERAISYMHFALKMHGYLFLGISETPGNLEIYFDVVHNRNKIYQKKNDVRIPISRFAAPAIKVNMLSNNQNTWPKGVRHVSRVRAKNELSVAAEYLLGRYAPPTILVNDENEIVYVNGDIEPYTRKLSQGEFRGVLDDILLPQVVVSVSTALYRTKKENKDICYRAVKFPSHKGEHQVDITVSSISPRTGAAFSLYAICFEELQQHNPDFTPSVSTNLTQDTIARINQLEEELAESRDQLRITVEELETTNEELQSANEELMAANEELQSTNEELQSVNEELYTVNQEFQEKILELTQTYSDINNLLISTNLAVVFLDSALRIRRFTPACSRYFSFRDIDIGRYFTHFATDLELPDIQALYQTVLEKGKSFGFAIKSAKSNCVSLRMLPYRNHDDTIEGVVLIVEEPNPNPANP